MGPGHRSPVKFMQIKEGKIVIGSKDNADVYDNFEGFLIDITYKEGTINVQGTQKNIKQWNIKFNDGEIDYIWSADFDGFLFQGFLNCIASLDDYSVPIKLVPWFKDNRNKLVVYANGTKLDWKFSQEQMPQVTPIIVDGEELKDGKGNTMYNKTARMKWVTEQVNIINQKIKSINRVEEVTLKEDKF